ncbi:hypothetical protein LAZ67_5003668 [Cordylochernes scorpioides]|uniref:Uncharacterized protein n=1 Tax=Cordylochernes scorpioides TaxID=51811 RepID=A0ABY6KKZ3_9ARAC|nr:hypothetical protein LAZ67_5003668 [Cordylochernes scorpioides]
MAGGPQCPSHTDSLHHTIYWGGLDPHWGALTNGRVDEAEKDDSGHCADVVGEVGETFGEDIVEAVAHTPELGGKPGRRGEPTAGRPRRDGHYPPVSRLDDVIEDSLGETQQVVAVLIHILILLQTGGVHLVAHTGLVQQGPNVGLQQAVQVAGTVDLEAEGHDLTAQAVAPKQRDIREMSQIWSTIFSTKDRAIESKSSNLQQNSGFFKTAFRAVQTTSKLLCGKFLKGKTMGMKHHKPLKCGHGESFSKCHGQIKCGQIMRVNDLEKMLMLGKIGGRGKIFNELVRRGQESYQKDTISLLEEELRLGLHLVPSVTLLRLQGQAQQEGPHSLHAGLVQVPQQAHVSCGDDLVAVAHHPVCQVLHHLVAELHLMAERQVISPGHHGFHQLAHLDFDMDDMNGGVQMAHIAHNGQDHALNAGHTELLCGMGVLCGGRELQNTPHYKDDVFNELGVGLLHHHLKQPNQGMYLSLMVKELVHNGPDLVKEDGVEVGAQLMGHQLLDMLLDLGAKLLIGAHQESQQLADELSHGQY